jgi:uroporphyrin-III C-methyltransferase
MNIAERAQSVLSRLPALKPGHVWLAGAGPGDPGLLTLHALAGLIQAEVVVHDALVDAKVLALAQPEAELVFAGKRGGRPSVDQADITMHLVALARANRRVLRLKGGDPFVFGRGGEEMLKLAEAGIPFRVIPGVTAGLGGLAAALIPATQRGVNQAILFATGHSADNASGGELDWEAVARLDQPLVLYMAAARIAGISQRLLHGGLPGNTPAAVIHAATTPDQRIHLTSLAYLAEAIAGAPSSLPAIIIIGRIVTIRSRLLALLPLLEQEIEAWPPRH